jgi:hypothetical protein
LHASPDNCYEKIDISELIVIINIYTIYLWTSKPLSTQQIWREWFI